MKTLTTPRSIEANSRSWPRRVRHLFVPLISLLGFLMLAPVASAQTITFKNVGKEYIEVAVFEVGDSMQIIPILSWQLRADQVGVWNRSDQSKFHIRVYYMERFSTECVLYNVSGDVERIDVALNPCKITIVPKTVVRFCNENPDKVYVAYVYWLDKEKGWTSNGWRTVEARKCEDVSLAYYEDYIYYYAADDGEGRWSGNTEFCVHWTAGFKLPNSDKSSCPERNGYRRVGMTKLAVKRGITTQRLVPAPLSKTPPAPPPKPQPETDVIVTVCNQSGFDSINFVLAYVVDVDVGGPDFYVVTEGWWEVAKDQCKNIQLAARMEKWRNPNLPASVNIIPKVYIYGEVGRFIKRVWEGEGNNPEYCIRKDANFEYRQATEKKRECFGSKHERVRMNLVPRRGSGNSRFLWNFGDD